jgi:hypothetical protein
MGSLDVTAVPHRLLVRDSAETVERRRVVRAGRTTRAELGAAIGHKTLGALNNWMLGSGRSRGGRERPLRQRARGHPSGADHSRAWARE